MKKELSQRERLFLAGGGIALTVLIVLAGVVLPYQAAMSRMNSEIEHFQEQLQEVKHLRQEYLQLKKQASRLQRDLRRGEISAPLTFLEETAVSVAGRESLVLMRPLPTTTQGSLQVESIEFKMERIDLGQALRILKAMDSAKPPMRVDKLFLKQRFDDTGMLDMSVTTSAVRSS